MAFTDLGSLGAVGSTANNQNSLSLSTISAIAAGSLVVVVVAVDNPQNGGDSGVSSVTDLGGNTYIKAVQICNAVAAQGGASVSIWYTVATNAVAQQPAAITATFSVNTTSDASAMTAREFSIGAGSSVAIEGTPTTLLGNTAADPGALNVTTANIECLRVRGIASQVGNNTNLTPTASWTAWANGNSATTGTTGEMCARAESRIITGTGASSNPTYVSAIYASAYVAFKEVLPPATGTGTLVATGVPTATNLLLQSQEFGTAPWAPWGLASVSPDIGFAIDGTLTADGLFATAGTDQRYLWQDYIPAPAGDYTLSFYIKQYSHTWVRVHDNSYANFNVATGAIGLTGGSGFLSANVEPLVNGWFRCSITYTRGATGAPAIYLISGDVAATSWTATGTEGVEVWGGQLESGLVATPYIRTTTTPVTAGTLSGVGDVSDAPNRMQATPATLVGVGDVGWVCVGTLAAQNAGLVSNFALSSSTGTGALVAIPSSRTNLARWSQEIDNPGWIRFAICAADAAIAPDGTQTAERLTEVSADQGHYFYANGYFDQISGDDHYVVVSLYAKAETRNWIQVYPGTHGGVNFNLATGTVGWIADGRLIPSITNAGNGWWRCAVAYLNDGNPTTIIASVMSGDLQSTVPTYLGNGSSLLVWGAQVERRLVTTPTAYIATGATAVTVADTLIGTGTASWNATGALVAGSRTNLVQQSQAIDSGFWSKSEITVAANAVVAPDGTTTAETITSSNVLTQYHYFYLSNSVAWDKPAGVYTVSFYAKAGTGSWFQISESAGGAGWRNFNAATGAIGNGSGAHTPGASYVGNGWWRFWVTIPAKGETQSIRPFFFVLVDDAVSSAPPAHSSVVSFHFWGVQIEAGSVPTAYIATTFDPVTVGTPVTITGAGTVSSPPVTGTGTLTTAVAAVASFGNVASVGTGALVATGPLRTNLIKYSESFDNGLWQKSAASVAPNTIMSPPGSFSTGDELIEDGTNAAHFVYQSVATTQGIVHTFSTYAARGARVWLRLYVSHGDISWANFDLLTSAVGNTSGANVTARITRDVSGWDRCSVSFTTGNSSPSFICALLPSNLATQDSTYVGVNGSSIYLWGAQLETAAAATEYIPTSGTAASVPEVIKGSGVSQVIATGALVAQAHTSTGAGASESRSTSAALQAQSNFLQLGNGLSSSLGTAALASNVAAITGAGIGPSWVGTGALSAATVALTGAGTAVWNATGALTNPDRSIVVGAGAVSWAASGAILAQAATTVGPGVSGSTGTATLPSTAATMSGLGSAVTGVGGTGVFAASDAVIVSTGTSRSFGTAILPGTTSAIVASGIAQSFGTGALSSTGATLVGAGKSESFGTAALIDQAATIVGAGIAQHVATGTLPAGSSAIVATGLARWVATGALATGASAVAGTGSSFSTVTSAALFASTASLNGIEGVSIISGAGSVSAQSHTLAGVALSTSLGTGGLFEATSALAGAGLSRSLGSSTLTAQASVIAASGESRSQGTGALSSPASVLAGVGAILAAPTGTGALAAQAGVVLGVGGVTFIASGILAAQSAIIASTGIVLDAVTGTGALAPSLAAISGAGSIGVAPSGTGVLAASTASANGQGIRQWAATGALSAQVSTVTGAAVQGWIATGSLVANAPVVSSTGVATWAATGALPSTFATVSGAGLSSSSGLAPLAASRANVLGTEGVVVIQGAGALQAQSRVVAGAGIGRSFGVGSLVVPDSVELLAVGSVGSRGTGVLTCSSSSLNAIGAGQAQGVGALAAGAATLASTGGAALWTASGALQAGVSILTGLAVVKADGIGTLIPAISGLSGLGLSSSAGTGTLNSSPAAISGSAFLSTSGAGELEAQARVIIGTGFGLSRGTGALLTDPAALPGLGQSLAIGSGSVVAKPASVAGFADITAYGAGVLDSLDATISGSNLVVGAGVIDAAVCEVAGVGEVSEYIAPPPSDLPGSYPGTVTWYRSSGGMVAAPITPPPAWWLNAA